MKPTLSSQTEKNRLAAQILGRACTFWTGAANLRAARARHKRFTYGDQWSDPLTLPDGRTATLRSLAMECGKTPLTNNLIRRLVRCVVGHFRMSLDDEATDGQATAVSETDARKLARFRTVNRLDELDARTLEEFLISGCAIQRVAAGCRPHGCEIWADQVNPDTFIINPTADPRGWDSELVGQIHDLSLTEIVMRFCGGDFARAKEIAKIYSSKDSSPVDDGTLDSKSSRFYAAAPSRCRIFEIWTLEAHTALRCHDTESAKAYTLALTESVHIQAENRRRKAASRPGIFMRAVNETAWHCRWIAPDGTLISESLARRHPFAFKFYPLTDGEIHPLVEDVIDQQIYINRLITLVDHVVGSSAKGALLFPMSQKLRENSWEEIARAWASPDGIIPIAGTPGLPAPQQVSGNGADGGARELLQLQMKMFEDVSGVSNALMGRSTSGGNAGIERYEAEVRNATITIRDILDSFNDFRALRNSLALAPM